jgi:hypothetical protein
MAPMSDLPSPADELAIRLLDRWVSVVGADATRSLLHGRRRTVTHDQLDRTAAALESIGDDHALEDFILRSAPRWQAQLVVTAVVDLVGALGDLPRDDGQRTALRRQLDEKAPLARIAQDAVERQRV